MDGPSSFFDFRPFCPFSPTIFDTFRPNGFSGRVAKLCKVMNDKVTAVSVPQTSFYKFFSYF